MPDVDPNKTVFISYRRSVHKHLSLMLFKDLRTKGFDPFRDSDTMGSGEFEKIILNQIAARTHFVVLLSYGTLERCDEPGDWLRREIEQAIDLGLNIVPVLVDGFKFSDSEKYLTGKLSRLKSLQGQPLYTEESELYDVGFEKLVNQKLKLPIYPPVLQNTESFEKTKVEQIIEEAINAPTPTQEELIAEQFLIRGLEKEQRFELEIAIDDYTEAIRFNPNLAEAYYNRGLLYDNKGYLERAITDYKKVIALNSEHSDAHNNLGIAYLIKGNIQGAFYLCNKAVHIAADEITLTSRGEVYFVLKQYDKALADFVFANELNPELENAHAGIAIASYALGDINGAQLFWLGLIDLNEDYRDVEWVRGELNWAEPLVEAARKLISEL